MKVRCEHCVENDVWEKAYIKYGRNHMLNVLAKRRTSVADFTGSAMKLNTRGPSKATSRCLSTSTQSSPLWRTRTIKNTTKQNGGEGKELSPEPAFQGTPCSCAKSCCEPKCICFCCLQRLGAGYSPFHISTVC